MEHVAAHVLNSAVTRSGGNDFRQVEIDALEMRMASQDSGQDGTLAASDVHQLADGLEALVLGQEQRQQLVGVIGHRRLEDAQMLGVRVHILELIHPVCQFERVLAQQNRFTANSIAIPTTSVHSFLPHFNQHLVILGCHPGVTLANFTPEMIKSFAINRTDSCELDEIGDGAGGVAGVQDARQRRQSVTPDHRLRVALGAVLDLLREHALARHQAHGALQNLRVGLRRIRDMLHNLLACQHVLRRGRLGGHDLGDVELHHHPQRRSRRPARAHEHHRQLRLGVLHCLLVQIHWCRLRRTVGRVQWQPCAIHGGGRHSSLRLRISTAQATAPCNTIDREFLLIE